MKNRNNEIDPELKALWGERWESVQDELHALHSASAPTALKHRIMNRCFDSPRGMLRSRVGQLVAASVTTGLCALLLLRLNTSTISIEPITQDEVVVLAEALDGEIAVAQLNIDLLEDSDLIESNLEIL